MLASLVTQMMVMIPAMVLLVTAGWIVRLILAKLVEKTVVVGLVEVVSEGELLTEVLLLVALRLRDELVMILHLIDWQLSGLAGLR